MTADFAIEPPEHAGWLNVKLDEESGQCLVTMVKAAPRLSARKLEPRQEKAIVGLLSWRLTNLYRRFYVEPELGKRPDHTDTYRQLRYELDRAKRDKDRKSRRITELEEREAPIGYIRQAARADAAETRANDLERQVAELEAANRDLLLLLSNYAAEIESLKRPFKIVSGSAAGLVVTAVDDEDTPSFRRGWADILAGRTRTLEEMWAYVEGDEEE